MNPDMFSCLDIDARIPEDHLIRRMRMRVFIEVMQNTRRLRSPTQHPAQPDHVLNHKPSLLLRQLAQALQQLLLLLTQTRFVLGQ